MTIEHVWVCTCRTETPCEPEDMSLGSVFQCPGLQRVFGCVRPRGGGKVWIAISEQEVAFRPLRGAA
jgi:hypothetical protein